MGSKEKLKKKQVKAEQKALKKQLKYSDSLGLKELSHDISNILTGKTRKEKKVRFGQTLVSPAYFFAKRVESIIHMIIGGSIIISAIIAVIWGLSKTGDLLGVLISSWWGRIFLGIIGLSYLTMGLYTLFYKRE